MNAGFTLVNNGYLAIGMNVAINAPGAVQVINFGFGPGSNAYAFGGGPFGSFASRF